MRTSKQVDAVLLLETSHHAASYIHVIGIINQQNI